MVSPTGTGAILITGTVGVGKSTVAGHVGDILGSRRIPHAVLDLDHLRWSWPAPPDDPFNLTMELQNLTSVAANYRRAGISRYVLAGVLERRSDLTRYEHAVGDRISVVRLRADPQLLQQRLEARHEHDPAGRARHLARAGELDTILDTAHVSHHDIHIGIREPLPIAAEILTTIGW